MMDVSIYAVIDAGSVVNMVLWDGQTQFDPGEGLSLIKVPAGTDVDIGWTWSGSSFAAPVAS